MLMKQGSFSAPFGFFEVKDLSIHWGGGESHIGGGGIWEHPETPPQEDRGATRGVDPPSRKTVVPVGG